MSDHPLPSTMAQLLAQAAATHGERPFIHDGAQVLNFLELEAACRRVSGAMLAAGLGRGDRPVDRRVECKHDVGHGCHLSPGAHRTAIFPGPIRGARKYRKDGGNVTPARWIMPRQKKPGSNPL